MKLRHTLIALTTTALLALPAPADAEPRGKDRREAQRSHHRDAGKREHVQRRDHGDRFRQARRTIRHRTVERASERDLHRHRRPVVHHSDRDRRHYYRDRRDQRRPRVIIDYHRSEPLYCPPPRRHVVEKKVIVQRPVYERRVVTTTCPRPVVVERRVETRPRYVEYDYAGHAWNDLANGHHRAALDSFGILASSRRYDALPKIGYGLSAAGLYDDAVAATALRRALRVDASEVKRFRAAPRLASQLRDLERRYERAAKANPYDSDAVFLLAALRTLQGATITLDDLDGDLAMLAGEDRDLLGLGAPVVIDEGVGMYDE